MTVMAEFLVTFPNPRTADAHRAVEEVRTTLHRTRQRLVGKVSVFGQQDPQAYKVCGAIEAAPRVVCTVKNETGEPTHGK